MPPLLLLPDASLMYVHLEAPARPLLALDPFLGRLQMAHQRAQLRRQQGHHRHADDRRRLRRRTIESCDLCSATGGAAAGAVPRLHWTSSCDSACSTVEPNSLPTPSSHASTDGEPARLVPYAVASVESTGKKTVRYDIALDCDPMSVAATAPPVSSSLLDCSSYTSYTVESEMPLPLITSVSVSKVPKCDAMTEHSNDAENASLYTQRIRLLPWKRERRDPRSLPSDLVEPSPPPLEHTPPSDSSRPLSLGDRTNRTVRTLDQIVEDDASASFVPESSDEHEVPKKMNASFSTKSTDATEESASENRRRALLIRDPAEWQRIIIWAKHVASLLSVDRVDQETTCILMQAAEQRHSGKIAKPSGAYSRPALLMSTQRMSPGGSTMHRWESSWEARRSYATRPTLHWLECLFRRNRKPSTGYGGLSPMSHVPSSGASPMSLTQYFGEHKGHYRRVLGENRYLRVRTGVLVWVFFMALTRVERYRFFLSNEGEIMISKANPGHATRATPAGCFPRRRQRRTYGSSLPRELGGSDEVKPLPLDRLRAIDISQEVLQVLQEPALAAVRASAACALWNDQSNDPLLIASNRQADIEDIVFLIRFVQQYRGLELAHVHS